MALTEYTTPDPGGVGSLSPDITIGTRIRQERMRRKWKQEELAPRVGVSRALIGRWENNIGEPSVSQAIALAEVLEVSYGWLCGVPAQSRWSVETPAFEVHDGGASAQRELPFDRHLVSVGR